jgi:hypothetical protein
MAGLTAVPVGVERSPQWSNETAEEDQAIGMDFKA